MIRSTASAISTLPESVDLPIARASSAMQNSVTKGILEILHTLNHRNILGARCR